MTLRPGWADAAGKAESQKFREWPPAEVLPKHRIRRHKLDDLASSRRGAARGGPQANLNKKLKRLLGPAEEDDNA